MKKVIRLTESDIHNIIKKSVNRILKETEDFNDFDYVPSANDYEGIESNGLDNYDRFYNYDNKDEYFPEIDEFNLDDSDYRKEDIDPDDLSDLDLPESRRRMSKIIKESIRKVLREASADIAGNDGGNIITCYGNPGVINGKYQGSGAGTILGPSVIYLSCNPPTRGMKSMYGQFVPVKVDVSNFYRAKDAWEAKKLIGLVGFKDEYSGVLYHGNRDGDVCAVFDRSCIIG